MSDLYAPNPEGFYADNNTPDCHHTDVNINGDGSMSCQDCPTNITYPTGIHTPGGPAL